MAGESETTSSVLWLVCGGPGDEGLAGSYSVDVVQFLNGSLHKLILAEAPESSDHIELSRNHVSLDKVRKGLELLQHTLEFALDLHKGKRGFRILFPVLVAAGDSLEGDWLFG